MNKRTDKGRPKAPPGKNRGSSRPNVSKAPASRSSSSGKETPRTRPFSGDEEVRLNRFIARSGVCSRREADEMISAGRVKIDGKVVTELGTKVKASDSVEVNGRKIVPANLTYLLLNKPADTITTTSDEKGRTSVLDLIDAEQVNKKALFPVGRLDRHTTGVLLLTSDGDLAHRLMHPSYRIDKTYVVETREEITDEQINKLAEGIALDDGLAKADRISRPPGGVANAIAMSIHEGRNRQVRRMMEAIGHDVLRLERVRYAGLSTDGIRKGKWRRLDHKEVQALYKKVKL